MAMNNSCESLFGVGLAILALVMLLTVHRSSETSRSSLSESKISVSDLGLRFSMQR